MDSSFQWKKVPLSPGFMCTITQFSLHNMRGADEGAEAIIAGTVTVKGLAKEAGLPFCNVQLALGCPSRRTLARPVTNIASYECNEYYTGLTLSKN